MFSCIFSCILSDYYVLIDKVIPTPVLYRYECIKSLANNQRKCRKSYNPVQFVIIFIDMYSQNNIYVISIIHEVAEFSSCLNDRRTLFTTFTDVLFTSTLNASSRQQWILSPIFTALIILRNALDRYKRKISSQFSFKCCPCPFKS